MVAILLWTGIALDAGVLAGLALRGSWQKVVLLPPVVLAFLVSATSAGVCAHCNTWTFWLIKEFVHATLTFLLGLELSLRGFPRGSPGRRAALVWVSIVMAGATIAVVTRPAVIDMLPPLIAAVLCIYVGLTLVMARYAVSLGALHDALLYGFPCYLIVYVATWGFTGDDTRVANLLSPIAFDVFMLNLLCVVWQRGDEVRRPFALAACVRELPAFLRRHARRSHPSRRR
jgi:hypothetical protein